MNAGASYIAPVQIGEVMRAGAIGQVTASEHPGFTVGDYVYLDNVGGDVLEARGSTQCCRSLG